MTGSITVGNRTIAINGTGSMTTSGADFPKRFPVHLGGASNPAENFSLSYREISGGEKEAYIGVQKDDEEIDFSKRQVNVNYTEYSEYALIMQPQSILSGTVFWRIMASGAWNLRLLCRRAFRQCSTIPGQRRTVWTYEADRHLAGDAYAIEIGRRICL